MPTLRRIVTLLLLLAYVGQGVAAYAFACADMPPVNRAGDMAQQDDAMQHAGHHGAADSAQASADSGGDCCDEGLCTTSHCQQPAALPLTISASEPDFTGPYPGDARANPPSNPLDLLYRPPASL